MMNEHPYFHWDLLRQPLQTPQFGMAPSFFDVNSILELRKEKSRDAARSRRGKENYEFYELAKLLPLPAAITSQLDKASIIRLTISYLKLRNFSTHGDPQWTPADNGVGSIGSGCKNGKMLQGHRRMEMLDPFESQHGTHILQSLDGFAFILANDGRFLYISETVSIYLGLSQVEMAGSSIFDYVHHEDHGELTDNLGMCSVPAPGPSNTPPSSGSEDAGSPGQRSQSPSERGYSMVHQTDKNIHKSFCIRMKSTLTKRGAHVKTSGYRVLHILGTLRPQSIFGAGQANNQSGNSTGGGGGSNNADTLPMGLVGMAFALPPPTVSELRLEMDTFILRLSPGFRVIYCDPPLNGLLDLTQDDVNERLLYDLCHVADLKLLQQAHKDIITKGQALTDYWRMLNRHGGYTWIQTFATTLFNNKTPEDQTILTINYVISSARSQGCNEDLWQMTGDVTSSMSSTYRCPVRDQLLNGLHKKETKKDERPSSSCNSKPNDKPTPATRTSEKEKSENSEGRSMTSSKDSKRDNQVMSASSSTLEKESTKDSSVGNLLDGKNSRRKMDNPRKRKKSEEESDNSLVPAKTQNIGNSDSMSKISSQSSGFERPRGNTTKPPSFQATTNAMYYKDTPALSPSPEDLSVKKTSQTTHQVRDKSHKSCISTETSGKNITSTPGMETSSDQTTPRIQSSRNQVANSSVNELEAAMNRHLQTHALDCKISSISTEKGMNSHVLDNKSDAEVASTASKLLSIPPLIYQGGQWMPSSPRTPPATAGDILPTSDLLRSLYTTRESVIKTNARSQNQHNRSSSYLNGETPSSLLTPPEPESSSETSAGKNQSQQRSQLHLQTKEDEGDASQNTNNLQYVSPNINLHQSVKGSSDFGQRDSGYKDTSSIKDQFQFLPYKDSLSYIDHFASSSGYKEHISSTYKDFPQFKDIVPAFTIPNLVNPGARFQHNYHPLTHHFPIPVSSSMPTQNLVPTDPCNMTPPTSSSPDSTVKLSQNLNPHPNQHLSLSHHHQQQQHSQSRSTGSDNNTSSSQTLSTHHAHQTFSDNSSNNYSTDILNNGIGYSSSQLSNNKHQLTPIEFTHPHNIHHHPHHQPHHNPTSTSSPDNNNSSSSSGYHQYRPHQHHHHHLNNQDYSTSSFHASQDLAKAGGYYSMTPTPVASMYMELNNNAASHYDVCHRPTLTWY